MSLQATSCDPALSIHPFLQVPQVPANSCKRHSSQVLSCKLLHAAGTSGPFHASPLLQLACRNTFMPERYYWKSTYDRTTVTK
jgi:hypothetical protein